MKVLLILFIVQTMIAQSIFEPGNISTESAQEYSITFITNDWICFTRRGDDRKRVLYFSQRVEGKWSKPSVAPFSGQFDDEYSKFDAESQRIYFSSKRPFDDSSPTANDIWYSEYKDGKWSEAKHLDQNFSRPGIDSGGEGHGDMVYFHSDRSGKGMNSVDLYQLSFTDRSKQAEKLSISTDKVDGEPDVFADGKAMIFMSAGHGAIGNSDLFLSEKKKGKWQSPVALSKVNTKGWDYAPAISPDLKYLYYTKIENRKTNIYRIATKEITELKHLIK